MPCGKTFDTNFSRTTKLLGDKDATAIKKDGEDRKEFMSRCMSDPKVREEYKDNSQRVAVCISKATEGLDHIQAADMKMYFESYGSEEELTADNYHVPSEEDYLC